MERGCGWEEEMREELEREWRGGGEGWLDLSGCYTHRQRGRTCACYTDYCNAATRLQGGLGGLAMAAAMLLRARSP